MQQNPDVLQQVTGGWSPGLRIRFPKASLVPDYLWEHLVMPRFLTSYSLGVFSLKVGYCTSFRTTQSHLSEASIQIKARSSKGLGGEKPELEMVNLWFLPRASSNVIIILPCEYFGKLPLPGLPVSPWKLAIHCVMVGIFPILGWEIKVQIGHIPRSILYNKCYIIKA